MYHTIILLDYVLFRFYWVNSASETQRERERGVEKTETKEEAEQNVSA